MIRIGLDQYLYKRKKGDENYWEKTESIYWRKDNHIQAWFVKHCAEGDQDKTADGVIVSIAKLIELRDTIKDVLSSKTKDKAEELLPTVSGFFFGSTEYDEYYWSSLQTTLEGLNKVLEEDHEIDRMFDGYEFIYYASW